MQMPPVPSELRVDLAIDWRDDDIEHLKEQRKFWARREQEATDKAERKHCIRHVKAITPLINYLEGRHPVDFPAELRFIQMTALCFATSGPRTHFEDLWVDTRNESV